MGMCGFFQRFAGALFEKTIEKRRALLFGFTLLY